MEAERILEDVAASLARKIRAKIHILVTDNSNALEKLSQRLEEHSLLLELIQSQIHETKSDMDQLACLYELLERVFERSHMLVALVSSYGKEIERIELLRERILRDDQIDDFEFQLDLSS